MRKAKELSGHPEWQLITSGESNTILSNIERTIEHEHSTSSFKKQTQTQCFQTLIGLESIYLLVIELEPPIFTFKQTEIKHM